MTDTLAVLRGQFIERCRGDLMKLSRRRANSEEIALLVHRLAGAAGSFGFPEISVAAGAVDLRIRNGDAPTPADLEALMEALGNAINRDTEG